MESMIDPSVNEILQAHIREIGQTVFLGAPLRDMNREQLLGVVGYMLCETRRIREANAKTSRAMTKFYSFLRKP